MRDVIYVRLLICDIVLMNLLNLIRYCDMHYYRNVFRGGRICFCVAGKRVRQREKVTVNRGLPVAGRFARCG